MAVKDIRRESIEKALGEFRDRGLEAMLKKYGGRASRGWYIEDGGNQFDQKVIVRAAHWIQEGVQLQPRGSIRCDAGEVRPHLKKLGYQLTYRPTLRERMGDALDKAGATAIIQRPEVYVRPQRDQEDCEEVAERRDEE